MFPPKLGLTVSMIYLLVCFLVVGESTTLHLGFCLFECIDLNSTFCLLLLEYKLSEGHTSCISVCLPCTIQAPSTMKHAYMLREPNQYIQALYFP